MNRRTKASLSAGRRRWLAGEILLVHETINQDAGSR